MTTARQTEWLAAGNILQWHPEKRICSGKADNNKWVKIRRHHKAGDPKPALWVIRE